MYYLKIVQKGLFQAAHNDLKKSGSAKYIWQSHAKLGLFLKIKLATVQFPL
jgi:hypothetical protein